jgi:hypothetical protein
MRLYTEMTFDSLTYGVDFDFRDNRSVLAMAQDHMHARRGNYLQSTVECSLYKDITGKEWQGEDFLPVLPAPNRIVNWKKNLKAFC